MGRATAPVGTALNVRVPGMEDGCVGIFQGEKRLGTDFSGSFSPALREDFRRFRAHKASKTLTWIH